MIHFRYGQAWKREGHGSPHDAFGLELDGVDLLSGASEEPLERIVPELIDGLWGLVAGDVPLTGVPLPHAHLELLIRRDGGQAKLEVVSLARPARRLYGPLTVELEDLVAAAVECGRALLADFAEARVTIPAEVRKGFAGRIEKLARARVPHGGDESKKEGFSHLHRAQEPVGFAFTVEDPSELLRAFRPGLERGALGTLLTAGTVSLHVGSQTPWKASAPPFLVALELARQGQELAHALELEDARFRFTPGGQGRPVTIDLERRRLELVPGRAVDCDPRALAEACFDLGQRLALVVRAHAPAQGKNPWLVELQGRCREGLARLHRGVAPEPGTEPEKAPPRRRKRVDEEKPLPGPGRVRKLRFAQQWQQTNLTGDEPGSLRLGKRGPLVVTPELVTGLSPKGERLFARSGTHGVAVAPDGFVVSAEAERVVGLPEGRDASWLRDHDGLSIGPDLCRMDGLFVASAQGRGAVAWDALTGRERWRMLPVRITRAHLLVHGHRALMTTDTGLLYGLELADGQLRYRNRAPAPYLMAPVPWARRIVTVGGRGEQTFVGVSDVHSGRSVWVRELPLGTPSRPLVLGGRVLLAGVEGGEGVLVCLTSRGTVLWQRPLHLGEGPFGLIAVGRSVVVSGPSGAGAMFDLEGAQSWRVGTSAERGESLHAFVPPRAARGVVLLPGEVTRAVDPRGGRVLAEVHTGVGLCGLQVDSKLNLYALDEDGSLTAWRLSSSLAVL